MKKYLALFLSLVLALGMLAGCGQEESAKTPEEPKSSEEAKSSEEEAKPTEEYTGKDTLVIAQNADIYSMDPQLKKDTQSGRIKTLVFETLVNIDPNGGFLPGLAESWNIIDDTTLQFKIRDGVLFHTGEPLSMEDIFFSFQRGENAPQTSTTMEPIDIANLKELDGNILEMKLKYPYGAILTNLADSSCCIVSKAYVEEVGEEEFAQKPVGSGPYKFDKWIPGDRTELSRFEDYNGNMPKIKNIVFRVITEAANRAIELETGNVDIALDISPIDISNIASNDDLVLERGLNYAVTYMAMNLSKEPFNNPKVRQAVSLALDLPSIVKAVYQGTGSVGRGPVPESLDAFNPEIQPVEQDVEKAKALLAEAGFPDGFSCAILTSDHQQRIDFAEIAQNQLGAIGINCEVKIMEWGAYLDAIFAGEHEMTILGYSYGSDPGVGLTNLFESSNWGDNGNIAWYKNDRVDELLELQKTEMDAKKRFDMLAEVQELIYKDAPWVFIWQGENLNGVAKDLKGFKNIGDSMYRFQDMYFE